VQQASDPTGTYGFAYYNFAYYNMGRLISITTNYTFVPRPTKVVPKGVTTGMILTNYRTRVLIKNEQRADLRDDQVAHAHRLNEKSPTPCLEDQRQLAVSEE
jgi:hypothetical protein